MIALARNLCRDPKLCPVIEKSFGRRGERPQTRLRAIDGPMASGQAVVTNEEMVKAVLKHQRDLRAIDMEAYGVAHAASETPVGGTPALIVKGVSDFANPRKADDYQKYAAFVSASFAMAFIDDCYIQWQKSLD